jgi:biopolymer transport protein TolR
MAVNLGGKGGLKSEINVTPFVDVALVLLIIFMVVTPMLQRGKDVRLPKAHATGSGRTETDLVVVSITSDKRIWLNNVAYTERGLRVALSRELAQAASRKVLLKGDEALTVGDVRRAILSVRAAGAEGVTLGVQEARRD